MSQQIIKSERLNEEYIKIHHPSGLTLMLYPLKGYSTAYALFGTNYGSIDTCFKTESDPDLSPYPKALPIFGAQAV